MATIIFNAAWFKWFLMPNILFIIGYLTVTNNYYNNDSISNNKCLLLFTFNSGILLPVDYYLVVSALLMLSGLSCYLTLLVLHTLCHTRTLNSKIFSDISSIRETSEK